MPTEGYAEALSVTMKTLIVLEVEMTFKDHSRSSAMSSFVRLPGLCITDHKNRPDLHLLSDKNS